MGLRIAALVLAIVTMLAMLVFGAVTLVSLNITSPETDYVGGDALNAAADMQVSFEWLDAQYYMMIAFADDRERIYYLEQDIERFCGIFEEDMSYYEPYIRRADIMEMFRNISSAYYESYKPCLYGLMDGLKSGVPLSYNGDLLDELSAAYSDIADALSECRAIEYEMMNENAFAYGGSRQNALVIVTVVLMLTIGPVMALVGVTIAGVVTESKRRKLERQWQRQYAQQYYPEPALGQFPEPPVYTGEDDSPEI